MDTYLQDRQSVADLMTGWMHRHLAEWDQLFHADGVIEITWFEGKASDFVDGSMRMGAVRPPHQASCRRASGHLSRQQGYRRDKRHGHRRDRQTADRMQRALPLL